MKLTPFACSVHTHSTCCDGKNTLAEMVRTAFDSGVVYFGASGHSHTKNPDDAAFSLSADMRSYKAEVLRLREEYAGRMEVLLGIEWDSYSDVSNEGFDYWIGSAHYQKAGNGRFYPADWDDAHWAACRDEAFGGDALGVAEGYFREVCRVAAMKPTILGHIDLITKLNAGNKFFDEESPRYKAAGLEALHAADPKETLLEINTGAMARGYRDTPYPALFLLKEWRAMGGRIILTADAHSAGGLLHGYDRAIALAGAAGFDRSVLLTMAGPVECPL